MDTDIKKGKENGGGDIKYAERMEEWKSHRILLKHVTWMAFIFNNSFVISNHTDGDSLG